MITYSNVLVTMAIPICGNLMACQQRYHSYAPTCILRLPIAVNVFRVIAMSLYEMQQPP